MNNTTTLKMSENNFDLIRLLAALQVAFLHVLHTLTPELSTTTPAQILEVFPGVPIFFFISGLLISRSYERTRTQGEYFRNRALRIFPALHVCVLLNILIIFATGYFQDIDASWTQIAVLYLAKTTIFQFYNPEFMRHFGDGVLNGSLWTICVELQFYLLTPILYRLFRFSTTHQRISNTWLIGLIIVSIICNRALYSLHSEYWDNNYWKLARVSFLPWIYMFLVGVFVQRNFGLFAKLLAHPYLLLSVPVYATYACAMRKYGLQMDNSFSPALFFPLVFSIFILAYSAPKLAKKLLNGNDISYGIYIYHVPIMNMFIFYNVIGKLGYTLATLCIASALALASWMLIEKPSLRRKRLASHPIHTLTNDSI